PSPLAMAESPPEEDEYFRALFKARDEGRALKPPRAKPWRSRAMQGTLLYSTPGKNLGGGNF
ncbi:MAG: hypothetical protein AAB883_03420, partial [Patescibacteria group bacterium]